MKKKYDVKRGSAVWRHKMREEYKRSGMEVPEKFKLPNQKGVEKSKALKKKIK